MGTVKTITVSPDLTKVLVTVETVREAEELLTDKTIFWVVKPELFAGNITGLDTLLSGSYIGMRPSTEKGKAQQHFVGEQDPPILQAWAKGTTFKLQSKRLGSISLGSPIFFRDLEVGTVLGWDLGDLASNVTIHAFVRAPYDKYVHDDTSFWNASGLSVKLAKRHRRPDGIAQGPAAGRHRLRYTPSDSTQPVAAGPPVPALRQPRAGEVGGLRPPAAAPVGLSGLGRRPRRRRRRHPARPQDRRGDRRRPGLRSEAAIASWRRCTTAVEADRITNIAAAQGLAPGTLAAEMVRRGLRATLQAPSLITGRRSWRSNSFPMRRRRSSSATATSSSCRRPRPAASTASPARPTSSCPRSTASTSTASARASPAPPRGSTTRSTARSSRRRWRRSRRPWSTSRTSPASSTPTPRRRSSGCPRSPPSCRMPSPRPTACSARSTRATATIRASAATSTG